MTDYVTVNLSSKPHMPVTIPQTSNAEANKLIHSIQRAYPGYVRGVFKYFNEDPHLRDPGILRVVTDLIKNPNYQKLQDILKLRIAIQRLEQLIGSQGIKERKKAGHIIARLQDLVYELEQT